MDAAGGFVGGGDGLVEEEFCGGGGGGCVKDCNGGVVAGGVSGFVGGWSFLKLGKVVGGFKEREENTRRIQLRGRLIVVVEVR